MLSKGQADPTLPMLPAPTKVEMAGVGDLAGPWDSEGCNHPPPGHFLGGSL